MDSNNTHTLILRKLFIRLAYYAYDKQDVFVESINRISSTGKHKDEIIDVIDGMVLSPNQNFLILGQFTETAPYTSSYRSERHFYRSIPLRSEDYLRALEFNRLRNKYRHVTQLQNLFPSNTLMKLVRLLQKFSFKKSFTEEVVQDIQVPITHAGKFLDFFHKEVAIAPLWIYPEIRTDNTSKNYINFKFRDTIQTQENLPKNSLNNLIEKTVLNLTSHP